MNQNLWQMFVDGLQQVGILAVDPATFAASSGLAIADWEIMNYTGLGPTQGLGTPIPSNVFAWADPMPANTGRFYQPGSSLSDSYSMFLNSLSVAPADTATIVQARGNLLQFKMADGAGNSWPGYAITPGLNDFLISSLQSVSSQKAPQIDFTLDIPPSMPVAAGAMLRNLDESRKALLQSGAGIAAAAQPFDADPPFFGSDNLSMVTNRLEPARGIGLASASAIVDPGASATATITFQAQTAQMFVIQPFRWFSGAIVSAFYNHIDPASALAGKTIFGPGGFLSCRASQILVAFKRVVTVSGSSSLVAQIQSGVQQATSAFNIGSFYFAAGSSTVSVDQSTPGTIIFQDNTNAPSVIGLSVDNFHP